MKKLFALAISILMLLSLAACGGTAAPSSSAGPAPAGTPTVDAIKAAGKLVMLTNAPFAPYEYYDGNGIVGVDVDLAQMIADELGVELEVQSLDFDFLIEGASVGKGDIVAAAMSITPERLESVDFTVPYVDTQLVIVVPEGSDIKGADDLAGKTVAVQEMTTSDLYLMSEMPDVNVLRFKDATATGSAVMDKKADAIVMDILTAQNIVNANTGKLVILDEVLAEEQYAMAVPKGKEDLLAVMNQVLEKAVADGKVEELVAQHMAAMGEQ